MKTELGMRFKQPARAKWDKNSTAYPRGRTCQAAHGMPARQDLLGVVAIRNGVSNNTGGAVLARTCAARRLAEPPAAVPLLCSCHAVGLGMLPRAYCRGSGRERMRSAAGPLPLHASIARHGVGRTCRREPATGATLYSRSGRGYYLL